MADHIKAVLQENVRIWNDYFKNHNWKGLSELYTLDCSLMPPNSPLVKGRDGIIQTMAAVHAGGIDKVVLELLEVKYSSGDLAAERGIFQMLTADRTVVQKGKYLVIWKRINDKWYLHNDLFNSDSPGPKSLEDEIKGRNLVWMQHFKLKNLKSLVDYYTEDCKILPSDGPIVQGRSEAAKMFETIWESGIDYIELHPIDIQAMGEDMAMDIGTFTMYNKEGIKVNVGKYLVTWRKINDTYYMDYDAFNDGN